MTETVHLETLIERLVVDVDNISSTLAKLTEAVYTLKSIQVEQARMSRDHDALREKVDRHDKELILASQVLVAVNEIKVDARESRAKTFADLSEAFTRIRTSESSVAVLENEVRDYKNIVRAIGMAITALIVGALWKLIAK